MVGNSKQYDPNEVNGNREGPHLRGKVYPGEYHPQTTLWTDMSSEMDCLVPSGTEDERFSSAERALASIQEDPGYLDSHLSRSDESIEDEMIRSRAISLGLVDENGEIIGMGGPSDSDASGYTGDEDYDDLIIRFGHNVAESYCNIRDMMSYLSEHDTQIKALMADMFELMTPEGQEKLFQDLYHNLPEEAKNKLAISGF